MSKFNTFHFQAPHFVGKINKPFRFESARNLTHEIFMPILKRKFCFLTKKLLILLRLAKKTL